METRSRKLPEASSSSPAAADVEPAAKRRRASRAAALVPMDSSSSSDSSSRRRRRRRGRGRHRQSSPPPEPNPSTSTPIVAPQNDTDTGPDVLRSAGSSRAYHELMRRMGAVADDLTPSSSSQSAGGDHNRILRAGESGARAVAVLTRLSEFLSMGTEQSLRSLQVDAFVPFLVRFLNCKSNPDIMLLAARSLTHLCEALPSSCAVVVKYGAVPIFCARLLTIEYMDLAEQSLQALKKISQEHPTACLRAGALMAVLSYLDFFPTGVQRVALSTATNICKVLSSDAADFIMEAVPLLTNLLHSNDSKVLDHASFCLARFAEAFSSSSEKLDKLCSHGLVAETAQFISVSNSGEHASLSASTFSNLICLLSTCASGSPLVSRTLLLLGISGILKDILSGPGRIPSVFTSPALTRPTGQIYEIVSLADVLLPPLPHGTISIPICSEIPAKGSAKKESLASSSGKQEETNGTVPNEVSACEKLLIDKPELLQQFAMDLLPVLAQLFGSSFNGPVLHKCLSVIGKLMYFGSADIIQSLHRTTNMASFLAGVLAWKDPQLLILSLQLAEILMEKLPGIFSKMFMREGVLHAIDALINLNSSNKIPSQRPVSGQDNYSFSGTSSRSQRYQRRSGCLNTDSCLFNDLKGSVPGNTGSTPIPIELPNANSSLCATVSARAEAFKDKYFPAYSRATKSGVSDELRNLKNLCSRLNTSIEEFRTKTIGKPNTSGAGMSAAELLDGVMTEMLAELSKADSVSTFEFISSGVVTALLNYFSCGTFAKERISEADLPRFHSLALIRCRSFVAIALDVKEGNTAPMTILVQKLQSALSSLERFPVVLSPSGSACPSSASSTLSDPLKLRLCRAQSEKSLRDFSSNIVLIDPLATLAAVEEFLLPQVQQSEFELEPLASVGNSDPRAKSNGAGASSPYSSTGASGRCPSTRSWASLTIGGAARKNLPESYANPSNIKGKAVLESTYDEGRQPRTRNASRIRASDKVTETKLAHSASISEDEDLDTTPVDVDEDETLMVNEDDASRDEGDTSGDEDDTHEEVFHPGYIPDVKKVHDVKLEDPATDATFASARHGSRLKRSSGSYERTASIRGTVSTGVRSGIAFDSRGSMSFAAALAGLTSDLNIVGQDRHETHPSGSLNNHQNKLIFTAGGKQLNKHISIYQAIQGQHLFVDDDNAKINDFSSMSSYASRFSDVFTITYQKADIQVDNISQEGSHPSMTRSSTFSGTEARWRDMSLLDSILLGDLPCELEKSNPTYNILALLRILAGVNQLAPRLRSWTVSTDFAKGKLSSLDELVNRGSKVPSDEFINNKLTPKLARQIQDALALFTGSLPSWCYQITTACPFLFPFETRRQYFYSTAFGLSRALLFLQKQQNDTHSSTNQREIRVNRLQRQKVRVSRSSILNSATTVMEMYSSQKAILEVEYFGEVGTGLGPTLEFYTLLSHELQKFGLGLWRSDYASDTQSMQIDENEIKNINNDEVSFEKKLKFNLAVRRRDFIQAPLGLFPCPWPPNADVSDASQFCKVIKYFRLVGRTMAKALQDGRLLDLPLSTAFYKLLLGQDLHLYEIMSFDFEFGKILQEMQALVDRKKFFEETPCNNPKATIDLLFRGTPVEDLCLDFTLPGYPEYILKKGGESTLVSIDNLDEYISLVVDATVKTGIAPQMEAVRAGFNEVFNLSSLQIFSPHEIDDLICGGGELWKPEALVDHIKFDHGYTAKSPAIINFLEIMGDFTQEQQQAFCQFVTGARRLPPGGLATLNPKLTVVRKHSANTTMDGVGASESADDDLPSVMTCANYVKLPPYSTKEIMYQKLMYAISEGQGSFDLS